MYSINLTSFPHTVERTEMPNSWICKTASFTLVDETRGTVTFDYAIIEVPKQNPPILSHHSDGDQIRYQVSMKAPRLISYKVTGQEEVQIQ